jgi:hypothetical protein
VQRVPFEVQRVPFELQRVPFESGIGAGPAPTRNASLSRAVAARCRAVKYWSNDYAASRR